jgi:hypothetical protein
LLSRIFNLSTPLLLVPITFDSLSATSTPNFKKMMIKPMQPYLTIYYIFFIPLSAPAITQRTGLL